MLSLPQSTSSNDNDITVTENAETMRYLLTLTYPCTDDSHDPSSESLEKIVHLLRTSIKYNLDLATSKLTETLTTMANNNPSFAPSIAPSIYIIGCVLNLDELARKASTACLNCGFSELLKVYPSNPSTRHRRRESDMEKHLRILKEELSPIHYQRLLNFHHQRCLEVKKEIEWLRHDRYQPHLCQKSPKCSDKFVGYIIKEAIQEMDTHGPNSLTKFGGKVLAKCMCRADYKIAAKLSLK
jgi:hypothetical protein